MDTAPDLQTNQGERSPPVNWSLFLPWAGLAAVAAVAIIPYLQDVLRATGQSTMATETAVITALQNWVTAIGALVTGMLLASSTKLSLQRNAVEHRGRRSWLLISVLSGLLIGISISIADPWLEKWLMPTISANTVGDLSKLGEIALWKQVCASFSAGVIEELLFRVGLLASIMWVVQKPVINRWLPGSAFWTANIASAVLFGLLHLSNVGGFSIPITFGLAIYAIVGNAPAGVIFGWLYRRYGLIAPILAHIVADITLRVFVPLVVGVVS